MIHGGNHQAVGEVGPERMAADDSLDTSKPGIADILSIATVSVTESLKIHVYLLCDVWFGIC